MKSVSFFPKKTGNLWERSFHGCIRPPRSTAAPLLLVLAPLVLVRPVNRTLDQERSTLITSFINKTTTLRDCVPQNVPIARCQSTLLQQHRRQLRRVFVQLPVCPLLLDGGRGRLKKGHGQLIGEPCDVNAKAIEHGLGQLLLFAVFLHHCLGRRRFGFDFLAWPPPETRVHKSAGRAMQMVTLSFGQKQFPCLAIVLFILLY
jgi:hypothetical protein